MFNWLASLWEGRTSRPLTPSELELVSLIEDRRCLVEAEASYRDFGFDDLAAESRRQIRQLGKKIREMSNNLRPSSDSDAAGP